MVMVSPTLYCGLERAVTLEEGGRGGGGEEGGRRGGGEEGGRGGGGEEGGRRGGGGGEGRGGEKEQDSSGLLWNMHTLIPRSLLKLRMLKPSQSLCLYNTVQ